MIEIKGFVFRSSKKKPQLFLAFIKIFEIHLPLIGYINKLNLCDEFVLDHKQR